MSAADPALRARAQHWADWLKSVGAVMSFDEPERGRVHAAIAVWEAMAGVLAEGGFQNCASWLRDSLDAAVRTHHGIRGVYGTNNDWRALWACMQSIADLPPKEEPKALSTFVIMRRMVRTTEQMGTEGAPLPYTPASRWEPFAEIEADDAGDALPAAVEVWLQDAHPGEYLVAQLRALVSVEAPAKPRNIVRVERDFR